jgi:hypothetical protein
VETTATPGARTTRLSSDVRVRRGDGVRTI